MKLLITPTNLIPIYEQIEEQIKEQILKGEIQPHTALPSIRVLAKELQVGVITVRRAYDDLCAAGYAYAVQSKGVYVAEIDRNTVNDIHDFELREMIRQWIGYAEKYNVSMEKLTKIFEEEKNRK